MLFVICSVSVTVQFIVVHVVATVAMFALAQRHETSVTSQPVLITALLRHAVCRRSVLG